MRVLDVGCGANLIYPLLGAALCGWRFVGSDVTDAALDWAGRNAAASPHLAPLIELRRVGVLNCEQRQVPPQHGCAACHAPLYVCTCQ